MDTLYINQSCIFPLFERPLQPVDYLRPAVAPIFKEKRCFEKMREAIYDYFRVNNNNYLEYYAKSHKWIKPSDIAPCPVTHAPFILDLGQICFNTRSAYDLNHGCLRQWFAFHISNSSSYWRKSGKNYKDFCNCHDSEVFGYLPNLEDQRMNFLYFELNPPLKFRIYNTAEQSVGTGKLFIHIFPTGYLSLNLVISYQDCRQIHTKDTLSSVINQLAPWRENKELMIHSKLGKTSLNGLIKTVLKKISHSFFSIPKEITRKLDWHCNALIISENPKTVLKECIGIDPETERVFQRRIHLRRDCLSHKQVTDYICAKGRFLFYVTDTRRKGILHSFWRLQQLRDFVEYKKLIYDSYIDYLKSEALQIKKLMYERISFEKIFGKNVYQPDIMVHLLALDRMVRSLSQAERALYSYISDEYGFDQCRKHLLDSLEKWERCVKGWSDKDPKLPELVDLFCKPFELFH